jgi:cytochrome P460
MRLFACCLVALAALAVSDRPTLSAADRTAPPASDQPVFTPEGELVLPAEYRQWVFLGSGLGMTYGPAAPRPGENPAFDNVFVNPSAFERFKETGRWPDGTVFALEVRFSTSNGSINKGGHYQTDLAALEVEVKDAKRFPQGMSFFAFGGGLNAPATKARPLASQAGCIDCHTKHGAVDGTFVQFYPTALAVAEAKGTLRADFVPPPPSPARFGQVLHEKGWTAAEKILAQARSQDPYASVAQEGPLNRVGYGLLQQKDNANAIALFRWIAEAFPTSANARDSLAEAYETDGKQKEALAETDRALALVEADAALQAEAKARLRHSCEERKTRLAPR